VDLSTEGFLPKLRELVAYHDAPVHTITYYVQWLLMRQVAAEGYRVSISGTAADELFTGYYDHHLFYLAEMQGTDLFDRSMQNWQREVAPWVRNPFLRDPSTILGDPSFRGHIFLESDIFSGLTRKGWSEPFGETRYTGKVLRNRMFNELFHEAVPVILHEDDLNAMYYSVENRSPFLDRGLFEATTSFPTRCLIREGRAKAVLREALRGIAPDCVVDNPRKVGFNAPIEDLFDPADPENRAFLLSDGPIFDLVDRDAFTEFLGSETERLSNSRSKFLFSFLSARLFLDGFAGS
jgi:asparagine synthase (glutamine-hydrolysing)